jgi:arylsulfatase A-like enzyme
MICYSPDQKAPGKPSNALTEFVDIYPSLCELVGIPVPEFLEGTSFAPLMDSPDLPWKSAAFSLYPRGKTMGWSMRTDRYRYTEWGNLKQEAQFRELYDHETDPDENVNIAGRPEMAETVAQLSHQLHRGWRGALPPKA